MHRAQGAPLPTPETAVSEFQPPRSEGVRPLSRMVARLRSLSPVDLLITAAFAVVLVVQVSQHEMWRDEIHSWGLVLASPTLPDLFANLRFTGHPGLWYVLLWTASWLTDAPQTVQIVHATIAIALIGMIGLFSPFSRLEKLLLLSSYFVLFEYTVVSRNYGIGFLIALIYAQIRATRPDRFYLNACLLGLLANTNMFAFVLSAALAFEYALALLWRQGKTITATLREIAPPALVYVAFAAAAVATMWPSPDISWRTTGAPLKNLWDVSWLVDTIAGNVTALLPTRPLDYWSSQTKGVLHSGDAAILPALALVLFYIFRANRRLLLILAMTAAGSIAIGQLVYSNSMRHWGINFIALVAALWMQRIWTPQRRSYPVLALLAVNAVAGIAVSVQQFPLAFSEGKAAAQWIRDNGLSDAALVGTPDTFVTVVAQYLGKPIYFLDCSCTDTYVLYHKRRDAYDPGQMPDRLVRALRELEGRQVVFLITHPLRELELARLQAVGISAALLAAFDKASTDENFYVYRVAAAHSAGGQLSE